MSRSPHYSILGAYEASDRRHETYDRPAGISSDEILLVEFPCLFCGREMNSVRLALQNSIANYQWVTRCGITMFMTMSYGRLAWQPLDPWPKPFSTVAPPALVPFFNALANIGYAEAAIRAAVKDTASRAHILNPSNKDEDPTTRRFALIEVDE